MWADWARQALRWPSRSPRAGLSPMAAFAPSAPPLVRADLESLLLVLVSHHRTLYLPLVSASGDGLPVRDGFSASLALVRFTLYCFLPVYCCAREVNV